MRFRDRLDAGRQLATRLSEFVGRRDLLVLGLPRGGVPVAREVASALNATLDVWLVRKLGVPGHAELAMGAIAPAHIEVLNHELVRELRIPTAAIEQVAERERIELNRRDRLYRGGRPPITAAGRTVILVDDGLATGASMAAAIAALRQQQPAAIVVGVPVGAPETCKRIEIADQLVCVNMPERFEAVGLWYEDFSQTSDDEVRRLLAWDAPM